MITTIYAGCGVRPELNRAIGDFVSFRCFGHIDGFERHSSMAVMDGGKLIAGTVYHNWQPDGGVIELSSASDSKRWLTRPVIHAMFSLPFDQYGCQLCVLRVSERNAPMLRIAKAYGFNEYIVPRLRGRDEAEHILTLTDDQWRGSRFRPRSA